MILLVIHSLFLAHRSVIFQITKNEHLKEMNSQRYYVWMSATLSQLIREFDKLWIKISISPFDNVQFAWNPCTFSFPSPHKRVETYILMIIVVQCSMLFILLMHFEFCVHVLFRSLIKHTHTHTHHPQSGWMRAVFVFAFSNVK